MAAMRGVKVGDQQKTLDMTIPVAAGVTVVAAAVLWFAWPLLVGLTMLVLLFGLSLLPIIIAWSRNHPNALPITVISLFFGWTLFGFGIALAWSLTAFDRK